MGLRVYDFLCPNGHLVEQFVNDDIVENQCPHCDAMGHRQIAAPRAQLEGLSGAFPGAADKWERTRASHMAKEQKNQANHGTYK
jgi:hypothetical protein